MTTSGESPQALSAEDDRIVEHLLVLRAQVGDREAYAGLFDRYHGRLLGYVHRLVGSSADAEDVVQDVWIAVVRKLPTLEQPSAFRAWLYRIAHNRAISQMRKTHREVPLDDMSEHAEAIPAAGPDDEDVSAFAEHDGAAMHEALERLSVAHREALTLRFLDGLTYEEIAGVVGCGVGTVRSRIHYGKKALQQTLVMARSGKP